MTTCPRRMTPALKQSSITHVHLIERVRRDPAGAITHVGWYRQELPVHLAGRSDRVLVEADVAAVIAVIRAGWQVNVVVGLVIGQGVQISPDGTTIVDGGHQKALRLQDLPSL